MTASLIDQAQELASLNAQIKVLTKKADALKDNLKKNLADGCHVLGTAIIEIRTQDTSRLNKEAACAFFKVDVKELDAFSVVTTSRVLTAKESTVPALSVAA